MSDENSSEGFKVTDKRHFQEDGAPRETETEKPRKEEQPRGGSSGSSPKDEMPIGELPRIDFPSYILSYYTQGLVLLGEVPNPITNTKEEDIEASKHTIDILAMLQEKTKGNLSKEEDQLLDGVLYELRMKFLAKTNRIKL